MNSRYTYNCKCTCNNIRYATTDNMYLYATLAIYLQYRCHATADMQVHANGLMSTH